ncbi:MAG: acyl carrier protein [Clostridiales bacterium]|nr:acyl carrier protein [Clostridiales bacterium]
MVLEKVKELVAEQLGVDKSTIAENSNIIEDLGADSLDVIEMLMALEEEYGITIPDEKIGQIKTIGQIVELIESSEK